MASNLLITSVRTFSTASANLQLVKAPVQVFGIHGRYATALYSAASKQKVLEKVEEDLIKLQGSIEKDERFREFLLNPTINRVNKAGALKQIADKQKLQPPTGNLLQLMAENGRLKNLHAVITAFKTMMSAHRGDVICEITTAKQLESDQLKKLEDVLKSFLKAKQSIKLTTKVDPAIIGGMIVSIGDKYTDMSVASKIKKYTDLISAAV